MGKRTVISRYVPGHKRDRLAVDLVMVTASERPWMPCIEICIYIKLSNIGLPAPCRENSQDELQLVCATACL